MDPINLLWSRSSDKKLGTYQTVTDSPQYIQSYYHVPQQLVGVNIKSLEVWGLVSEYLDLSNTWKLANKDVS